MKSTIVGLSGRPPPKVAKTDPGKQILMCVWCREANNNLKYVLPTQHGKKEFCTEVCLAEFRRAYNKGACAFCDNVLRGVPIRLEGSMHSKEFCSTECLAKYQKKDLQRSPCSTSLISSNYTANKEPCETLTRKNALKFPSTPCNFATEVNNSGFNWKDYIRGNNAIIAPSNCFQQHITPPTNHFKLNMKLEAVDPRNTTSICIATVVGTIGARIKLRLDGSDNSNDFWRLVDSSEINPIGHCEKNGGMLQPPLGFLKNASFWPMFLLKSLNGALVAGDECFKRSPQCPKGNYFKPGMKLEAVDRKNPHLICPATVGAINGEMIQVIFDGWLGTFDYWTRFDSRDIFPVGWCSRSGHPLQPPGQKGPLPLPPIESKDNPVITVNINKSCHLGPYFDCAKIDSLSTTYGPLSPSDMFKEVIQLLLDCSNDFKEVSRFVPQVSRNATSGKYRLKLKTIDSVEDFWSEIQQLLKKVGCCLGLIGIGECHICTGKTDDEFDMNSDSSRSSNVCNSPVGTESLISTSCVTEQAQIVQIPPNKINPTTQDIPQKLQCINVTPIKYETLQLEQQVSSTITRNPIQANGQGRVDPSEWTVEEVIRYIVDKDVNMAAYADSFRQHEIDGKAMILLNSDILMKHMDLKLGPALKICNIIGKFKNSKRYSPNGA